MPFYSNSSYPTLLQGLPLLGAHCSLASFKEHPKFSSRDHFSHQCQNLKYTHSLSFLLNNCHMFSIIIYFSLQVFYVYVCTYLVQQYTTHSVLATLWPYWLWSLIIFLIQRTFFFQLCLYPMNTLHHRRMYTPPHGGVQRGFPLLLGLGGHPPGWEGSGESKPLAGVWGKIPEGKFAL
jgi:hypothetical protein